MKQEFVNNVGHDLAVTTMFSVLDFFKLSDFSNKRVETREMDTLLA